MSVMLWRCLFLFTDFQASMKPLIVLIDSGWSKYSSRFVARNRLGCIPNAEDRQGNIALSNDSRAASTIYDVLAMTLRSKLKDIAAMFQQPAHVIICKDEGNSWRAGIPRTVLPGGEQASGVAYKAGRHEDDPANLAAMYKLNRMYEDAVDMVCRYSGFDVASSKSVEADDFMVVLSNYYANHGYNVVIVSEDADIMQAVHKFEGGGHILIYRPRHADEPLVCSPASLEHLKQPTIFDNDLFDTALSKYTQKCKVVAPQYLLLNKIMLGDASDAISPVMQRCSGNRHYNLRSKDLDAIALACAAKHDMPYMPKESLWTDYMLILQMAHQALFKQSFDDLPQDWQTFYVNKYIENVQMVCIDEHVMPSLWADLQAYGAQLTLHTINLEIPTTNILNRIGI